MSETEAPAIHTTPSLIERADQFFRSPDTWLAKIIQFAESQKEVHIVNAGTETLTACGNGTVSIHCNGMVELSCRDRFMGKLMITDHSGDMQFCIPEHASLRSVGEGRYEYQDSASREDSPPISANFQGSNLTIEFTGMGIELTATGSYSTILSGIGTYTLYGERYTGGDWVGRGDSYAHSRLKRILDLGVSIPAAIIATPTICILGLAKKLEDGGSIFFVQERVTDKPDRSLSLRKLRSMREGSDNGIDCLAIEKKHVDPGTDPRATRLGAFMRRFQLDELPQVFQILMDQLSVVGLRPLPQYVLDYLQQKWAPDKNKSWVQDDRYERWLRGYMASSLGLINLTALIAPYRSKGRETGYHPDIFYLRNQSLGLDLYLMWRAFAKLTRLLNNGS